MSSILVVAKKEIQEIATNRGTLISTAFLALFFGVSNGIASSSSSLSGLALYLTSFVGVMAGFMLCGSVFFREKQTGVIETLLCTPLDLRSIWLGKTVGVTLPSYILAVGATMVVASINPASNPVSLSLVLILVGVAPLLIAASVGIVGFVQLALGMRENRILSFVIFIFIIAGLTSIGQIAISEDTVWMGAAVLLAVSAALLGAALLLVNRLKKEKIVTTIPD